MFVKNLIIIKESTIEEIKVKSTGSSLRDHIPKRKKVKRKMRKDLVFRYLNSIETAIQRLKNQLTHDSYTKLATGQTSFSDLSDTELEFMKEHLHLSIIHSEEILTQLEEESKKRK